MKEKRNEEKTTRDKAVDNYNIILYNDNVNTFDFVIRSLIEICGHDFIQAEQCAITIHNNGKCDIKNGKYDELFATYIELSNRNLTVSIE